MAWTWVTRHRVDQEKPVVAEVAEHLVEEQPA